MRATQLQLGVIGGAVRTKATRGLVPSGEERQMSNEERLMADQGNHKEHENIAPAHRCVAARRFL